MVTVIQIRNLKFKINAKDHNPPHVHVEGGGASVRINLLTLEVMDKKTGFSATALKMIERYVLVNREIFLEKWVEYHG